MEMSSGYVTGIDHGIVSTSTGHEYYVDDILAARSQNDLGNTMTYSQFGELKDVCEYIVGGQDLVDAHHGLK